MKRVADFPEAPTVSRSRPARRGCRRSVALSACAAAIMWACGLGSPPTADAANVSPAPTDAYGLAVTDLANEKNAMTVRAAPGKVIFEGRYGVLTTTAPQCVALAAWYVECADIGMASLTAQLGGGDDQFVLDASISTVAGVAFVSIDGGAGQDVLIASTGDQTLLGGSGSDRIEAGVGNDVLAGGDGNDVLIGGAGDDVLSGDTGGDLINGNAGTDTLDGGLGDDSVNGGPGSDTQVGGPGVDLLAARDGASDAVSCGGRLDLAIVDPIDTVGDCEPDHVDDGQRQRPILGEAARAIPEGGTVRLRLAGADRDRFYPLHDDVNVPLRSALDASDGRVRVRTTKSRGGTVQDASFSRGKFSVHQARTKRPVTEFRLIGGSFTACDRSRRGKASAVVPLGHEGRAPIRIRQLQTVTGHRKGDYRIIGRYGIAAPDGTNWVTEDRCGRTVVTRVVQGTVLLRNRRRGGVVRAGNTRHRGAVRVGGRNTRTAGRYSSAAAEG